MAERSITIEEVISQALLLFDNQDSRDEMVFKEWGFQALRLIGPSNVDTHRECVDICDLSFEKPCGFISSLEINLLNESNNILSYEHSVDKKATSEAQGYRNRNGLVITLTESKECFVLSDNEPSKQAVRAEIVYYGYPINSDGEMLIEENMEDAIIRYIEWQWTRRERRRDRGNVRNIPLNEERVMKDDWTSALRRTKGNIKMISPAEANTIFRNWNTAIPNFQNKARHKRGSINKY